MKKQTPENIVKSAVKKYLHYQGWYSFPILQSLGAHKGIVDRIAIKNGIVLFIECKSSRGWQSDYQKQFQKDIKYHDGHYVLVREIQDLIDYIESLKGGGR